jgi:SAM-dependent methyltransferase
MQRKNAGTGKEVTAKKTATPKAVDDFLGFLDQYGNLGPVLDADCGRGKYTKRIAKTGREVLGIDYSQDAIDKARKKVRGKGITFAWVDRDNFSESLKMGCLIGSGYFSAIFSDDIERQSVKSIKPLAGLLGPGGLLYLRVEKSITDFVGTAFSKTSSYNQLSDGHIRRYFDIIEERDLHLEAADGIHTHGIITYKLRKK